MGKLTPSIDPATLTSDVMPVPTPPSPPPEAPDLDLAARLERIEAALGLDLVVEEPVEVRNAAADAAARRRSLAGGVRIVAIPAPPAPSVGQPTPRVGLDIAVADDAGTPVLITLQAGMKFEPGVVADSIESVSATGAFAGLIVERLANEGISR
jgi:hypothetical protein